MEVRKITVEELCNKVKEKTPVPGGGAVGAVAAALAGSLNSMVANLTFGKKKYEEFEGLMQEVLENMELVVEKSLKLAEEDVKAFDAVMAAYKLPKEEPNREEKIQEALKKAIETPFELIECARDILKYSEIVAKWGNKNAVSDAFSAAELARAACKIGEYNVMINLKSITDENYKNKILDEMYEVMHEAKVYYDRIQELVKENGFTKI
ncbi:cyclodeaminase/cyclohydrolase family protein [Fervidobacterium nodosum]|uniref:Formiminotransferase-cyclodeaminase n=1 Tax=Fervidobacterium nodosum (strain ATCC 35602 / DSM 5306 / Rt17-B1) TaxID=381764 RepID=A7HLH1_FERNB|nr:cyclodeaminase/cyclohydrolase family protein [Fervidobacterium nodosum]ABS60754.1 Formiminotransferase-cyclodeaminase [Fervidobacterium nodosum Rt17-B1]PHJ14209.1 formiminotransferase-cyclodeaminase [Fervidobacterium sp. SC_NGM5_G05]HOJ94823.1 cyclodeaminase/cyclohydrolase family protein [Fervidobacterium nodosum]